MATTDKKLELSEIQRRLVHRLVNENAEISEVVDVVIEQGTRHKASDIHFEAFKDVLRVRYRIDGFFRDVVTLPAEHHDRIIARLKVMADLNAHEKNKPQDSRISTNIGNKRVDFRISTVPTVNGEKAVVRVFDSTRFVFDIDKLGLYPETQKKFEEVLLGLQGSIIVAGPTGSGKTTTLYAALQKLSKVKDDCASIITIEDPVEVNFGLFPQMEVKRKLGLHFADCLRAVLRQDPEAIMVGEIRDPETCEIAMRAGLTGHLVLSTLHTNNAPATITRLLDMGIEPYLVASSIVAACAQRLVRKLCEKCKEKYQPTKELLASIGLTPQEAAGITFYKSVGCHDCNNTGFKGRLAIFEIMEMTNEIARLTIERADTNRLRQQAQADGMTLLLQDGVRKIAQGLTTIDEVLSVAARGQEELEVE